MEAKIVIETILDRIYREIIEKKYEEVSLDGKLSMTGDSQNSDWEKATKKFLKEKQWKSNNKFLLFFF